MDRRFGWAAAAAYVVTILVANWLVAHVGIVDVGFGVQAPAAVFAAGLAFTFRDLVQLELGRGAVLGVIVVGTALSFIVSPTFAVASGVAFLVSEMADFAVYTPLAERDLVAAVVASNVVGSVLDSLIFLSIAFGSLEFLPGQIVGKLWMTALAIPLLMLGRRALLSRHA